MKLIHRVRNTRRSPLRKQYRDVILLCATPGQAEILLQYMEHVYPTVSSYIDTFWTVLFYISITLFYAIGSTVLVMYLIGSTVPMIIYYRLYSLFMMMMFMPEFSQCTSIVGIAMWVGYVSRLYQREYVAEYVAIYETS
jgi:hypothetical protein